ncbi:MAG: hypothetical protein ACOC8X_02940, partial [Chloroflexota bacterium]
MLTLSTFLILLLAGSAVTVALTLFRPRFAVAGAAVTLAITTLLWLVALVRLPLSYTTSAPLSPVAGFTWTWHVARPLWILSLALFLLQIGALLYLNTVATAGKRPVPVQALTVVLLGAAAHLSFWASSLPALVAGWSLLALFWGLGRWEHAGKSFNVEQALGRAGFSLGAIFLLWLGAATIPGPDETADAGLWPTLTTSLVLLAIVVQLALAPLALWQTRRRHDRSNSLLVLCIIPGAAGAALLLRLEAASDIGLAFALPLTLAGLFALLWAARLGWSAAGGKGRLAPALVVAQSGLVLLAGVWANPQA